MYASAGRAQTPRRTINDDIEILSLRFITHLALGSENATNIQHIANRNFELPRITSSGADKIARRRRPPLRLQAYQVVEISDLEIGVMHQAVDDDSWSSINLDALYKCNISLNDRNSSGVVSAALEFDAVRDSSQRSHATYRQNHERGVPSVHRVVKCRESVMRSSLFGRASKWICQWVIRQLMGMKYDCQLVGVFLPNRVKYVCVACTCRSLEVAEHGNFESGVYRADLPSSTKEILPTLHPYQLLSSSVRTELRSAAEEVAPGDDERTAGDHDGGCI